MILSIFLFSIIELDCSEDCVTIRRNHLWSKRRKWIAFLRNRDRFDQTTKKKELEKGN